jgi:Domain of unknown function (DUF4389)
MNTAAVQVDMQRPERSSRLKLLFRWLLILPQYFFLIAVGLVAAVMMIINYFVVLIAGRAVFVGFLSGVLRYITRVNAYMFLLTDAYPPFSLGEEPDYPVSVTIAPPGRIHRWRFFSFILAMPHVLVLYVLEILTGLSTFIAAIVILIFGRYPAGLFGIAASTVRYQARVNAYLYLITDSYPPFSLS